MNKARLLPLFFYFAMLALAGCSKPAYREIDQLKISGHDKEQVMKQSEKVLTSMQFTIDKFDVESGLVQSNPLRGAQWFEFWRKDNVGSFNKAEANLHSLRRQVTIQVDQLDDQLLVKCDAQIQRLDLSEKPNATERRGGMEIYDIFSNSTEKMQTLQLDRMKMTWIDLGPDKQLQGYILTKIQNNLDKKKK
jgi:hypothetical protein